MPQSAIRKIVASIIEDIKEPFSAHRMKKSCCICQIVIEPLPFQLSTERKGKCSNRLPLFILVGRYFTILDPSTSYMHIDNFFESKNRKLCRYSCDQTLKTTIGDWWKERLIYSKMSNNCKNTNFSCNGRYKQHFNV